MQQKAFKKLSTARKNANGGPIVQCGDFYIVGMEPLQSCSIINPNSGHTVAHISMSKLECLGNGNWATPADEEKRPGVLFEYKSFYKRFLNNSYQ